MIWLRFLLILCSVTCAAQVAFSGAGSPRDCPADSVFDSATLSCTPCPYSLQERNSNNTCACPWPQGFLQEPQEGDSCAVCPSGMLPHLGTQICVECPEDADCTGNIQCNDGKIFQLQDTDDGVTLVCAECPDGEERVNATACTACPAGMEIVDGVCACSQSDQTRVRNWCVSTSLYSALQIRYPQHSTVSFTGINIRVTSSVAMEGGAEDGRARGFLVAAALCQDASVNSVERELACAELAHLCALQHGNTDGAACRELSNAVGQGAPVVSQVQQGILTELVDDIHLSSDPRASATSESIGFIDIVASLYTLSGQYLSTVPVQELLPPNCGAPLYASAILGRGSATSCVISREALHRSLLTLSQTSGFDYFTDRGATSVFASFFLRVPRDSCPTCGWVALPVADASLEANQAALDQGLASGSLPHGSASSILATRVLLVDELLGSDTAVGQVTVAQTLDCLEVSISSQHPLQAYTPLIIIHHDIAALPATPIYSPFTSGISAELAGDVANDSSLVTFRYGWEYGNMDSSLLKVTTITFIVVSCVCALVAVIALVALSKRSFGMLSAAFLLDVLFVLSAAMLIDTVLCSFIIEIACAIQARGIPTRALFTNSEDALRINQIVSFVAALLTTLLMIYRQSQISLIPVDWERPIVSDSAVVLAKDGVSPGQAGFIQDQRVFAEKLGGTVELAPVGTPRDVPQPPAQEQPQAPVPGTSAWRFLIAANTWRRLATKRRYSAVLASALGAAMLYGCGWLRLGGRIVPTHFTLLPQTMEEYEDTTLSSSNIGIDLLTVCGFYTVIAIICAAVQFIYGYFVSDPLYNFIDLLPVSNISMFIIDSPSGDSGFYIHGRSPQSSTDVPLSKLVTALQSEAQGLVGQRGLESGQSLQTYRVWFDTEAKGAIAQTHNRTDIAPPVNVPGEGVRRPPRKRRLPLMEQITKIQKASQILKLRVESLGPGGRAPVNRSFFQTAFDIPPVTATPDQTLFVRDPSQSFKRTSLYGQALLTLACEWAILGFFVIFTHSVAYSFAMLLIFVGFFAFVRHLAINRSLRVMSAVPTEFLLN